MPAYGEMVILVPVSCSIFFRFRPSFPINLPTKLLCASIFSGISSVLHEDKRSRTVTSSVRLNVNEKQNNFQARKKKSLQRPYSQFSVDRFLLHDLHDGHTGVGTTFRCGVNSDGLLCCACVLFPMDVDPAENTERSASVSSTPSTTRQCIRLNKKNKTMVLQIHVGDHQSSKQAM